jgi:hypothetical protein
MSTSKGLSLISYEAAGDLTQFRFGSLNSDGQIATTGAGAQADGVIQNDPDNQGEAVTIATYNGGQAKVEAGGSVSAGDNVTSDSNGRAVTATSGDVVNGVAVQAASGAGSVIGVTLSHGGAAVA